MDTTARPTYGYLESRIEYSEVNHSFETHDMFRLRNFMLQTNVWTLSTIREPWYLLAMGASFVQKMVGITCAP